MADGITYVGLDVHVATIALAVAHPDGRSDDLGIIPNDPSALAKRLRRLGPPQTLQVCYEAGPCGYGIVRQLRGLGIACQVVAPSLIPRRPGDRVKTDRRDALKLARLLRSGELTAIAVPTPEQEALRALSRARESAQRDLHRVRQRLLKVLAQHGLPEPPGRRWTQRWWRWLAGITLPYSAAQVVLDDLRDTITAAQDRVARLTAHLLATAAESPQAPQVTALQQLHGVGPLTAIGIVTEVGDLTRFTRAPQLFAYAGLVPREHSSGGRTHRGAITKTGNGHLRFLLVEAAWHSTRRMRTHPTPSTDPVGQIAHQARTRLPRRYARLVARGKPRQLAAVAIARELLGFVWAIGHTVAPTSATGGTPMPA